MKYVVEGGVEAIGQMFGLSKTPDAERQCDIRSKMLGQAAAVVDSALLGSDGRIIVRLV